jgi:hypothetical protein
MLPVNRKGAWVTKALEGRRIESVSSNLGDSSGDDLRIHPGHPEQCPPRSLIVFDVDKVDTRPPGVAMRMVFDFNLYPNGGPSLPISADYLIIAEYNAWPDKGVGWAPPPFSLDAHFDRSTRKESLFASVWGMAGTKALPISRGTTHHVEVEYVFTAGAPGGRAKVLLDGAVLVDYSGPTGKLGYTGVFPAFGLYGTVWRPRRESIMIDFENFRERII